MCLKRPAQRSLCPNRTRLPHRRAAACGRGWCGGARPETACMVQVVMRRLACRIYEEGCESDSTSGGAGLLSWTQQLGGDRHAQCVRGGCGLGVRGCGGRSSQARSRAARASRTGIDRANQGHGHAKGRERLLPRTSRIVGIWHPLLARLPFAPLLASFGRRCLASGSVPFPFVPRKE